eukprot:362159-Chlamydomonas_euryale.AAC.12
MHRVSVVQMVQQATCAYWAVEASFVPQCLRRSSGNSAAAESHAGCPHAEKHTPWDQFRAPQAGRPMTAHQGPGYQCQEADPGRQRQNHNERSIPGYPC